MNESIFLERIVDGSLGVTADKLIEFIAAAVQRLNPAYSRVMVTFNEGKVKSLLIPENAFIGSPAAMPDIVREHNGFWSEDLERLVVEATRKLAVKAGLQEF